MKSKFRRRQVKYGLSQSEDTNLKDIYKLDLKQTIEWMCEIWMNLDEQIIYNFYDTTGQINF